MSLPASILPRRAGREQVGRKSLDLTLSAEHSRRPLEMAAATDEKRRRLAELLDKLNNRGGTAVLQHGHQLGAKKDQARAAGP